MQFGVLVGYEKDVRPASQVAGKINKSSGQGEAKLWFKRIHLDCFSKSTPTQEIKKAHSSRASKIL